MRGWVVSLDLWGTLLDVSDRAAAAHWRLREFELVLRSFGHDVRADVLANAVATVRKQTRDRQRSSGHQTPVRDQVTAMVDQLNLADNATGVLIDVLLVAHTHALLRACPRPIGSAHAVLSAIRETGAVLVLTSNTLATPAPVTAPLLDNFGLTEFFDHLLFSDELGVAKPHPDVFAAISQRTRTPLERVIHVGDDLHTDVKASTAAGCHSIWLSTKPQLGFSTIRHLDDILPALSRISASPETVAANGNRP